jgi:hypothetical protein
MPAQLRKINELTDRAQHVIGRHEFVEAKFVKTRADRPSSPESPCRHSSRESQPRAGREHFFNKIGAIPKWLGAPRSSYSWFKPDTAKTNTLSN